LTDELHPLCFDAPTVEKQNKEKRIHRANDNEADSFSGQQSPQPTLLVGQEQANDAPNAQISKQARHKARHRGLKKDLDFGHEL
jgi:hypothetical protein